MRGGILFISGGDGHARAVFRHQGRGDWSQAFPLVLEKYGYLDVTTADAAALTKPWDQYAAVVIARLPGHVWTRRLAQRVREGPTPVYVDGPLAPVVADAAGVDVQGPGSLCGVLTVQDPELGALATKLGVEPGGRLRPLTSRPILRDPGYDWRGIGAVPITETQADTWRTPSWSVSEWKPRDIDRVLASWTGEGGNASTPALVRRGSLFASAVTLLAFLGERHASVPFDGDEHRVAQRVAATEVLLLGLIDLMYRYAGVSRPRVLPWPNGKRWGRSIRHDYDRPITVEDARQILRRHAEVASAATWYWRGCRADDAALQVVRGAPGHEIALHTERVWAGGERERREVESAVGRVVRGSSAHGTRDSFRYQGAPNVLWAERQGFQYTEALEHGHYHPHRLAVLNETGVVRFLKVLALPHHASFDLNMRQTRAALIRRTPARWRAVGGFLQIMSHPDLHVDQLFCVLREMPAADRMDWTAAEAADWWRRTHVVGALVIRTTESGFILRSAAAIDRIVLEVLDPDGSLVEYVVDVEPDEDLEVRHERE